MKHKNGVRGRLLALLLCLSLLVQMSAAAWAAEADLGDEGMLHPDASVSETAEPESTELETQADAPEAEESAEAPAEESAPQEKSEKKEEEKSETRAPKEPDVDTPEFWSEFRNEYADDADYLKRYEAYQEQGVKRAFEDDEDIPGTIEGLSTQELELMASSNTTKSPFTGKTYTHADSQKGRTVVLGIDVSKWQNSIDWAKVKKAGVKFVILRCGYTNLSKFNMHEDEMFEKYITPAYNAGLKVGVYYFSQAVTTSEAEKEAKKTIEILKPYKSMISLPVFMDYESISGARIKKVGRTDGTKIIQKYLKTVAAGGYTADIYANTWDMTNKCDPAQVSDYGYWMAWYSDNDSKSKPTKPTYSGKYDFWQYSSKGKVNGISGSVDCNFWYTGKAEAAETTAADTTKPAKVTGLSVTATGTTSVDLKWTVISNAESYTVEGKTEGGSYAKLMTYTGDFSKGNTCRVTGLVPATAYSIRVKAVNRKGTGAASAAVSVITQAEEGMTRGMVLNDGEEGTDTPTGTEEPTGTDVEPEVDQEHLGKPEKLTVKVTDEGDALSWTAVPDAKHYRVFFKSGTETSWTAYADVDETSILIPNAENNCEYAVRCVNKSGSYASDAYTAAYRLGTPTITSVENNGKQVKVKWKKVKGAKQYMVFYCYLDKINSKKMDESEWKKVGVTSSNFIVQPGGKGDQILFVVRCCVSDNTGKAYYSSEYDKNGLVALRAPKLKSVKNSKKGTLAAEWDGNVWSDSKGKNLGYEVQFVLSGKVAKKKTLTGGKSCKFTATDLKKGKTYEVSVRTWRKAKVNGKNQTYYSPWGGVKKVKVKK